MPLTFPSHAAAVVPLKLWRPRWFDGVALVTGSVAPDVSHLALGLHSPTSNGTHSWLSLLWWSLPVGWGYAWVVRRSAAPIAAHLPAGRWFALRDYAALSHARHPWWITVGSVLLGAASHLLWDRATHTDRWLLAVFGVDWQRATGVPWWTVADLASTAAGAAVMLGVAARIGTRRLLLHHRESRPAPPARGTRPLAFWTGTTVVAVLGTLVATRLPAADLPHATIVRLLHVAALALLAGAITAAVTATRSASPNSTQSP